MVDFILQVCYFDTLFAIWMFGHLRTHRIQPRFFYRCDGGRVKRLESWSVQIGGLVRYPQMEHCAGFPAAAVLETIKWSWSRGAGQTFNLIWRAKTKSFSQRNMTYRKL